MAVFTGATAANAFIEWRDTLRFTTGVMAIWRCDLCPAAGINLYLLFQFQY